MLNKMPKGKVVQKTTALNGFDETRQQGRESKGETFWPENSKEDDAINTEENRVKAAGLVVGMGPEERT